MRKRAPSSAPERSKVRPSGPRSPACAGFGRGYAEERTKHQDARHAERGGDEQSWHGILEGSRIGSVRPLDWRHTPDGATAHMVTPGRNSEMRIRNEGAKAGRIVSKAGLDGSLIPVRYGSFAETACRRQGLGGALRARTWAGIQRPPSRRADLRDLPPPTAPAAPLPSRPSACAPAPRRAWPASPDR
jgi:hypothetical protein